MAAGENVGLAEWIINDKYFLCKFMYVSFQNQF